MKKCMKFNFNDDRRRLQQSYESKRYQRYSEGLKDKLMRKGQMLVQRELHSLSKDSSHPLMPSASRELQITQSIKIFNPNGPQLAQKQAAAMRTSEKLVKPALQNQADGWPILPYMMCQAKPLCQKSSVRTQLQRSPVEDEMALQKSCETSTQQHMTSAQASPLNNVRIQSPFDVQHTANKSACNLFDKIIQEFKSTAGDV